MDDHNQQVMDFFERCKCDNPERYREIAERYPTLSSRRYRTIRSKEKTVGLLGLQPSNIPHSIAEQHGFDGGYDEGDD